MWNAWFDRNGAFAEIDALTREIEGALQRNNTDSARFDLREQEAAYVLAADLPGLEPGAVVLDVQDGMLTLKAERPSDAPKGYAPRHRERAAWRVERAFALPENVDVAGISARLEHGTLAVTLPKKPAQEPRRITITS